MTKSHLFLTRTDLAEVLKKSLWEIIYLQPAKFQVTPNNTMSEKKRFLEGELIFHLSVSKRKLTKLSYVENVLLDEQRAWPS